MKNPLRKRLPRELKSEFGKYFVIFFLMFATIGLVSGYLVAGNSMVAAYDETFEKYNIEDGNLRLAEKANKALIKELENNEITLYDNFYVDDAMENSTTLRIFANRTEVNTVCLMDGVMPTAYDEIGLDRMYAVNNNITIGDTLSDGTNTFRVTGLIALPDYSCLFQDNNDSMFDAQKFGVSIVTAESFARFSESDLTWSYSWKYDAPPADDAEANDMAEDLMKSIAAETELKSFVPRYQNQAIVFTGDDMEGDQVMVLVLLYIVMIIMAFVFGITTSNTILKEANVIGTLRASGYTKMELIHHYMTLPLLVSGVGAVLGNILGYTWMKDFCASLYYASYSLTTFHVLWNANAFLLTTIIPLIMMTVITFLVLTRKLSLSPLKFLHKDFSRKKQRKAFPLSSRLPFFSRFRIRVILQNMGNYITLFIGILFANFLLFFGLLFSSVLAHYQADIEQNLLCNYQYILQIPLNAVNENKKLESALNMMLFQNEVETETEGAEKFSIRSLNTTYEGSRVEAITLYGVEPDSRYVSLSSAEGTVAASQAYADKYDLTPGDTITLKEAYEDTTYTFTITDIYPYDGALALFMPREDLNRVFDEDKNSFSGYLSNEEITDIDTEYISSIIDLEALTKISRQLTLSMGGMMNLVNGFAIIIFLVIVYLLSKIIIEKNGQAISMTKILGYSNREISRLYIFSTTFMVLLSILISLPLEVASMKFLFKYMMTEMMTGWISFYLDPMILVEMVSMGLGSYAIVAFLEYRRIRRIPMDEALKNVE